MSRRISVMLGGLAAMAAMWAAVRGSRGRGPAEDQRPASVPTAIMILSVCVASGAVWAAMASYGTQDRALPLMRRYGCPGCHAIPGVPGGAGRVGPPLAGLAQRTFVAGVVRNEPELVVQWMVDPPRFDPRTAMPRTGITEAEARAVAEYLYRH
jgi:hypothetical protein